MKTQPLTPKSNFKQLVREQRNFVSKKEKEIKRVDKHYKNKLSETKLNGEHQLRSLREKNKLKLLDEVNRHQKSIFKVRDKTNKESKKYIKQKLVLENNNRNSIGNKNKQFLERLNEIDQDHYKKTLNIRSDAQKKIGKGVSDSQKAISKLKYQTANQRNKIAQINNLKVSDDRSKFQDIHERNKIRFSDTLARQKLEQLNELTKQKKEHIYAKQEQSERFLSEKEGLKLKYKNELTRIHKDFNIKFKNLKNEQTITEKRLKEKSQNILQELSQKFSTKKVNIEDKATDSFYISNTLDPIISENEKEYLVKLAIPEHEKDLALLTGSGRKLRLSLTRKFSQDVTLNDGSVNKSLKTETYTKKFQTKDIINPNLIKKSYIDGVLTFILPKA